MDEMRDAFDLQKWKNCVIDNSSMSITNGIVRMKQEPARQNNTQFVLV